MEFGDVSLEEIKTAVVAISEEDRLHLSAFLRHLARVDTEENRAALSAANARIDAGDCMTLGDFRKLHAALEADGL